MRRIDPLSRQSPGFFVQTKCSTKSTVKENSLIISATVYR